MIEYLKSTHSSKNQQEEIQEFFAELPAPRQEDITLNIMFVSLSENEYMMEYLGQESATFIQMVKKISIEFVTPGVEILL